MITRDRDYPTRISCKFQGKQGQIILDQIGAVDKSRLVKRVGKIDKSTSEKILNILHEMFLP